MSPSKHQQVADAMLDLHPLQRLQSPSRSLSALFHALGLASFTYSFAYLINNPNEINASYGWHLQFLTNIGLLLATLTFVTGLAADATLSTRLFAVKNALSLTSAPLELLISVLYWGLRFIDPALVVPDWLPRLPWYSDASFHVAPAAFLVVDLLGFSPPWSIKAAPAMILSGGIATAYWFWVEHCYAHNGFYPYPVFEVEKSQRIGLFVGSALIMCCSTFSLQWIYYQINGKPLQINGKAQSGNVKNK